MLDRSYMTNHYCALPYHREILAERARLQATCVLASLQFEECQKEKLFPCCFVGCQRFRKQLENNVPMSILSGPIKQFVAIGLTQAITVNSLRYTHTIKQHVVIIKRKQIKTVTTHSNKSAS